MPGGRWGRACSGGPACCWSSSGSGSGSSRRGSGLAFDGSFVSDGFARFSKVLILFGAAAALALSHDYLVKAGLMKFEYPVLIVLFGRWA